jgi:hypothetical protein
VNFIYVRIGLINEAQIEMYHTYKDKDRIEHKGLHDTGFSIKSVTFILIFLMWYHWTLFCRMVMVKLSMVLN